MFLVQGISSLEPTFPSQISTPQSNLFSSESGRPYLPVGDVPDELRQNVQDGDEEVGDGEVVHEVVHPRRRLPAQLPPQRHQHDPVAEQGHQEDDGLQDGQRM